MTDNIVILCEVPFSFDEHQKKKYLQGETATF